MLILACSANIATNGNEVDNSLCCFQRGTAFKTISSDFTFDAVYIFSHGESSSFSFAETPDTHSILELIRFLGGIIAELVCISMAYKHFSVVFNLTYRNSSLSCLEESLSSQ